jgi:hypothetical protein
MLNHLKEKKEVGFFTSIAGLMNSCSVLDLDAFERNTKAEGLGVGSEGAAGEKNMHDAEFTCALFRFIQLTCEGHNLGITQIYSFKIIFIDISPLFRLAELFANSGWKYDDRKCCNLHR